LDPEGTAQLDDLLGCGRALAHRYAVERRLYFPRLHHVDGARREELGDQNAGCPDTGLPVVGQVLQG
jgi:hypothetical protein